MNHSAGVHDTLVYRLSQVLTKLNQGESLDPQSLADEFGVNLRTIQRDLNVRFACLPLVKSGGRYRMDEAHLGKLTIKDIEQFASLSGVSGLFPQLTDRFLRGVFDSANSNAWLVKDPFRYTQVSDQRFTDFDGTAKLLICIGLAKAGHEKCELVSY